MKTTYLSLFSLVMAFVAGPDALVAGDWPQWLGPNRDGKSTETGLLQSWPAGGPPLLWRVDNLGGGYSTPSVADGTIYGMGYRGNDEVVWALDEATGKEKWSAKTAQADRSLAGYAEGPRCTPAVDGDLIYTLGAGGNLTCLEANGGKIRWVRNLAKDFGGKMMSGWGYSESPLVDGDKVVCTPGGPGGAILALDKKTGNEIWRCKDLKDAASYASIVPAEIGGIKQYVQLLDSSVAGVDAADGSLLWRANRRGRTAVIPTPIVAGNEVYVTSGYGVGCNLFKVTPESGRFQTQEVYANKVMVNHHGGVVLVDGHVYGYSDGKGWVCQNFQSGEMVWEEKGKLGKGAIAYADKRLYLRSEGGPGTVALIEATPEGYHETGRFDQPSRSDKNSWPHPVIANGKLLIRDQGLLLVYDVKKK